MATSYTTILKLALPATGELSGTWGTTVNNNITQMVEEAVTGLASVSTWTANAHTLTTADGTTAESRCVMLDLSGTITAAGTLTIPASFKKLYVVRNGTTGGYAVNVGMATGTTATVPNGATMEIYCDGTNTKAVSPSITSGYEVNLTATADTTVTLPTSGTLLASGGALGTPSSGTLTNCTFPTLNQSTTGNAATATTANSVSNSGGWAVTPSGTTLYFAYNGTNVAKLDSSGNLTCLGNVVSNGTI